MTGLLKTSSSQLQSREEGDRARSKRRECHFSGGGGGPVSRGGSVSATSVVCGSECHVIIQSAPRQQVQSSVGPIATSAGPVIVWVPLVTFGEKLVLTNFDVLNPFLRPVSSNLDCLVLVDCCLSGTMTTLKFEVPLFDGRADFMLWQCTIQDYLVQQGLDLALQDEKPSDMKESEWSTIQKKAVSTIRLALSPQIKVTVLKETSPKKLWETLESKFASKTLTNRLMMRMDLYSLKMEEGELKEDLQILKEKKGKSKEASSANVITYEDDLF
ncbi:unnamed protein product [Cuscuta campestris]|uniref:Uncharacterized protein n=1 Tax=Cuscuta campestris TaxID=132261 RepID=A0A484ML99_9ASTE|nr:unnamed protein product [Cuscuta campestris]